MEKAGEVAHTDVFFEFGVKIVEDGLTHIDSDRGVGMKIVPMDGPFGCDFLCHRSMFLGNPGQKLFQCKRICIKPTGNSVGVSVVKSL